jgi:hypothetical protein
MTDMGTSMKSVFGTGIMLAMMLATLAAFAQEQGEDEELLPAVDTSAMVDEEELLPAVDTSAMADEEEAAGGVTRTTAGNRVMDTLELGRTEITGNQELPKVLYIVPWQKSDPGDLMGRPVNSLLDEVLAPLDREEFVRQVEYYNDLYGEEEEP